MFGAIRRSLDSWIFVLNSNF